METTSVQYSESTIAAEQQRFMVRVYNWMTMGLVVTAGIAYLVSTTPAIVQMVSNPWVLFPLIIAQLGLVIWLATRVPTP